MFMLSGELHSSLRCWYIKMDVQCGNIIFIINILVHCNLSFIKTFPQILNIP